VSVHWDGKIGYDGDFLHGRVLIDYWTGPTEFRDELERQIQEIRVQMLAKRQELMYEEDQ